jgi:tRNA-Thr(GGU) m(6)t(6)A37 methyltransferase TsaA
VSSDRENHDIVYHTIGVIHTPHTEPDQTPIQPAYAQGIAGRVVVDPAYEEGLRDLDGFSHVLLLYHLHRVKGPRLTVKPFLEDVDHGVFATRAPCRPNPIGISVVRLERLERNVLHVEDVDMLDGTPLLDIKPYVPRFVDDDEVRGGWTENLDPDEAQRRGTRRADAP